MESKLEILNSLSFKDKSIMKVKIKKLHLDAENTARMYMHLLRQQFPLTAKAIGWIN